MNYKKNVLFFCLLVIFIASCGNENNSKQNDSEEKKLPEIAVKKIEIKTNFFDLPDEASEKLKEIYNTKDLQILNEKNLYPMQKYIEKELLGIKNPNTINISGNYFWFIYNALPSFVTEKERHQGYYSGEGDFSEKEKLIAYSIYRIDRSSKNILRVFNTVKPILKKIVTVEMYNYLEMNLAVAALIGSYEQLIRMKDFDIKLGYAYDEIDTATGQYNNGKFEKFRDNHRFTAYELSEIISSHLAWDDKHSYYNSPALSFWMRRNKEGNLETVYKILTEIESIYSEDSH